MDPTIVDYLQWLSGIVTLVGPVVGPRVKDLGRRYQERPRAVAGFPVAEELRAPLARLARTAYVLLRLEQVPATGNWGQSMDQYIELTRRGDELILKERERYRQNGSITHTALALKAMSGHGCQVPGLAASAPTLLRWLYDTTSRKGYVDPPWPANPDEISLPEIRNYVSWLRHTATALVAVDYLRRHVCIPTDRLPPLRAGLASEADPLLSVVRLYGQKLTWLAEGTEQHSPFHGLWETDPMVTYTHAYVILALSRLRASGALKADGVRARIVREQIRRGLDTYFSLFASGSPFLHVSPEIASSRGFFTAHSLAQVLETPEAMAQRSHRERVVGILDACAERANPDGGFSFSGERPEGHYDRWTCSDLATTAKLATAVIRAEPAWKGTPRDGWLRRTIDRALHLLAGQAGRSLLGHPNRFTHAWVGILELVRLLDLDGEWELAPLVERTEPWIADVAGRLARAEPCPGELLRRLATSADAVPGFTDVVLHDLARTRASY